MKRYFAWKDANCNGENIEWVELTGAEFIKLKRENPNRKFIPWKNEDEEFSDEILYEVAPQIYRELDLEDKHMVRNEVYASKNFTFVSFDDLVNPDDDEGLTYAEIIADTRDEETREERRRQAFRAWLRKMLPEALNLLDQDQMNAINWIFLDEDGYFVVIDKRTGKKKRKHKPEKEVAEEHKIPEKTLNNRKNAALKIMRDFYLKKMAEKRIFVE